MLNSLTSLTSLTGMVLAGYAPDSSFQRDGDYAGQAGLVLAGVAAAVTVVLLAGRWIARHPEQVRGVATRQLERPRVAALSRRYRSQLTFLGKRLRPGNALGLALTVQLVALVAAGWAFGAILQDVLGGEDATRIDRPVIQYLTEHRTGWLTTAMKNVTWLGSTVAIVPFVALVGLEARRRTRSWAIMAQLGLSLGGAIALYNLVKPLVHRPRPHLGQLVATATGFSFPSGHAAQTAAVSVTLALIASMTTWSWAGKVAAWSAAVLVCVIIGFSRLYLGVHWPTDVLAGYTIGALWAALSGLAVRWWAAGRSDPGESATA